MKCLRCGLINPDVAQRCDCGFDFKTKTVERSYLRQDSPELAIRVYRVHTPDGVKDYVTCLPHEQVFAMGLAAGTVIGMLRRSLEPGERITPAVFARNPAFEDLLHEVVARRGPQLPGLIAEARRQRRGWVYIIDQRTRTPQGHVPPEDIVGAFTVKSGKIVPGSYQRSHKHVILSADGFFRLGAELQACLLEELASRMKTRQ
jgi:hypothetical protein